MDFNHDLVDILVDAFTGGFVTEATVDVLFELGETPAKAVTARRYVSISLRITSPLAPRVLHFPPPPSCPRAGQSAQQIPASPVPHC